MGKFPIALLIIVSQLFAISSIQADEQVRQLQEELRKRHLFYGNADGEFSPALVKALSHYQTKKGLPVTGLLDPETSASLGIRRLDPPVAPTPFVVAEGDVRGVNGELLPSSAPLFAWPVPRTWMQPGMAAEESGNLTPPDAPRRNIPLPAETRRKKVEAGRERRPSVKATNPFVIAYRSLDHAVKLIFQDTQPRKKRSLKKRT